MPNIAKIKPLDLNNDVNKMGVPYVGKTPEIPLVVIPVIPVASIDGLKPDPRCSQLTEQQRKETLGCF